MPPTITENNATIIEERFEEANLNEQPGPGEKERAQGKKKDSPYQKHGLWKNLPGWKLAAIARKKVQMRKGTKGEMKWKQRNWFATAGWLAGAVAISIILAPLN